MTQKRKTALAARLTHLVDQKWTVRAKAAQEIGIPAANLSRYLSGEKVPGTRTMMKFADALGVFLADLEGVGPKVADRGTFSLPNLGWVPAGKLADAASKQEMTTFHEMFGGDGMYTLDVRGDSMMGAGIFNHDVIVVKPATGADPGDIVVADVNGEKTVKTLGQVGGKLALLSFNDDYEPIILSERDDVAICGVVVGGVWLKKRRRVPAKPTYDKKPKGKK